MRNGLVSGVCLNGEKDSTILVFDIDPARAYRKAYGLPGGTIEDGEAEEKAMVREWREEVVKEYDGEPYLAYSHQRKERGRGEFFTQFFFSINPPDGNLRSEGVPGETGPPEWVRLVDIFSKRINMHYTHREGLKHVLELLAKRDPDVAFMMDRLGII